MRKLSRLLKLRAKMNKKRPKFMRLNVQGLKRLKDSWRRPKGLDNKIRMCRKGYPEVISIGYRSPRMVRGLHPSRLKEVLVHRVKELERLDPKKHCVRIASSVGRRKREEILKKASEMKLKVLNPAG